MKEYTKIDSIYKRDQKGKFIEGEYSRPEFEYLKDNLWNWTEKIDGTNIRIMWGDGTPIRYGGKTDNAQLPNKLVTWLNSHFKPFGYISIEEYGEQKFSELFGAAENVCLYGEGYGAGIQKGGGNYSSEQRFILFDVKIGDWWLLPEDVKEISSKLGLDMVPYVLTGTLSDAENYVKAGFNSFLGKGDFAAEGLVGTPVVPLFARNGHRIITKVKTKDYE